MSPARPAQSGNACAHNCRYRHIMAGSAVGLASPIASPEKLEPIERQLEVAQLCPQLQTYVEVPKRLGVAELTVAGHTRKVRQQLGAESNREVFLLLAQQGKLKLPKDEQ